jgi:hypothetical protein
MVDMEWDLDMVVVDLVVGHDLMVGVVHIEITVHQEEVDHLEWGKFIKYIMNKS